MASPPLLVIITGPSGVGKDSILTYLKSLNRPYHFAITATTRPPRPGDQEGVHYYFLNKEQFDKMLAQGEFLENATVYGYHYGVPKGPILQALAAGKDILLRTDIQGARYIKSLCPQAITIFLAPPAWEELERRLRARAGDEPGQMALRLRTAQEELAAAQEFDHIVVNDTLDEAVAAIEKIIVAERPKSRAPIRL